jgi:hypothetical protein
MRAAMFCLLALLAAMLSSVVPPAPEGSRIPTGSAHFSRCAKPGSATDEMHRSKPSSFAPHPGGHSHVYGAPIQSRIFKSRQKKNPQLKSAPFPDA